MPKLIDLTGKQFGELLVLNRVENDKHGKPRWMVRCSCGNEVIKTGNHLPDSRFCRRGGHSRIGIGEAAFNQICNHMRRNAIKRNYKWNLSKEQIRKISKQKCFYCGCEPSQIAKKPDTIGSYIYNGIDRIDNTKGYIIENVVPCCGNCNYMKSDLSSDNFRGHIISIYKHWAKLSSD